MKNKNYTLIIGLGITGFSCVKFFLKQGKTLRVVDTRNDPPQLKSLQKDYPEVPIHVGELPIDWLCNAEEIILSPGLSLAHPAIQEAQAKGIPIRGDIDVFAEYAKAPIMGITGSNGKSTVTSWLGAMSEFTGKNIMIGGNIGVPVLDLLQQPTPDAYVLELSSFQLETTDHLSLLSATILNISPDHLDRYADVAEYAAAKQRIYRQCQTAVYYRADPATKPVHPVTHSVSFGLDVPEVGHYGVCEISGRKYLAYGAETLMPVDEIGLPGSHNVLNALATLALGHTLGLNFADMCKGLKAFPGLPHRCKKVAEESGITWINDSKGTNVGATLAAIEGLAGELSGKLILILGGDGKGADFSPLIAPLMKHARAAILLGQDAEKIEDTLQGTIFLQRVKDLTEAVQQAALLAKSGDIVLLSPACSSLDMFASYAARGDEFARLVMEIVVR